RGIYILQSFRYAWTQDALRRYLAQGFSHREALALTSMDLGHGDGRGRYVVRVYGRREEE
ncbi:DNA-binding protein, partial [Klebsiella pneumoniae]